MLRVFVLKYLSGVLFLVSQSLEGEQTILKGVLICNFKCWCTDLGDSVNQVTARWLLDMEEYNEWMNEEDYLIEDEVRTTPQ